MSQSSDCLLNRICCRFELHKCQDPRLCLLTTVQNYWWITLSQLYRVSFKCDCRHLSIGWVWPLKSNAKNHRVSLYRPNISQMIWYETRLSTDTKFYHQTSANGCCLFILFLIKSLMFLQVRLFNTGSNAITLSIRFSWQLLLYNFAWKVHSDDIFFFFNPGHFVALVMSLYWHFILQVFGVLQLWHPILYNYWWLFPVQTTTNRPVLYYNVV